ncbi:MAG TPA: 50S ribosomal protein L7Ae-like protein [Peptococcaceae bacterium]|nr:50S ribosomal protein L7Ae-like protein [Peptococcaceae bacterium]
MSLNELKEAAHRVVGTRQTTKAVQEGRAKKVFIAEDAEDRITGPLIELCKAKGIEIVKVKSMKELGSTCGIDVGAASAAIIEG